MSTPAHLRALFAILFAAFFTGCATLPYRPATPHETARALLLRPDEPQLERGKPNKFLDASDWIWPGSWIGKLILWNRQVDSHQISTNTEEFLRAYLAHNNLTNVKVRINQYRPGDEWRRLFNNRAVGAGWRYTLGILSVAYYTILPGRFFGGDHYNSFTDTINLYSDIPAVAAHEGGHSKDWGEMKYKGTHAFLYMLPAAPLFYEATATADALSYLRETQSLDLQKQGYNTLYPAYGTYVGGTFGSLVYDPFGIYSIAFAIPGHIAGRVKSAQLADETPPPISAPESESDSDAPTAARPTLGN